ncbi:MAG TPA: maleylpyruvate isomerase N-terminal domain-containing protein [Kineosporiaceae bacterium]|nr:maleylpyruvate isomerase N-terminal domain-containing protein [Kineosporiaceae bacterium]
MTQPPASLEGHALTPVRARYLAAARTALALLDSPEVRDRWDEASALAELSVGDLAGHLALSGVLVVEQLLDVPDPRSPSPVTAGQYYGAFVGADDVGSELNVGVRERSHAVGVRGPEHVVEAASAALDRLTDRLAAEPPDRQVAARDSALTLEEYLRGRCVELAVHQEDLELSVGLGPGLTATDEVPDTADDVVLDAVDVLVAAAVARHGAAAVLRALTRRERDQVDALRVL